MRAKVAHYNRKSDGPVDASDWDDGKAFTGEEKTGPKVSPNSVEARKTPVPRAFKRGGAVPGANVKHHAGRKARAAGGPMMGSSAPASSAGLVTPGPIAPPAPPTNRFNFSPTSPGMMATAAGLKKGGRVKKSLGGDADGDSDDRAARATGGRTARASGGGAGEESAEKLYGSKKDWKTVGDRVFGPKPTPQPEAPKPRAHGGRAKGKTNVNIIIETQPKDQQPMGPAGPPPMMQKPMAPPAPPPGPPGMGGPGGPPGMPPGGGMGGPPPMMRAAGGKVGMPKAMVSGKGSGGGQGRMIKAKAYGDKC